MDDPVGLTISDPLGLAVAKGTCPVGLPPSQSSRASTHRQQSGSVGTSREATLFASAPARCRPPCLWPWAAGRGDTLLSLSQTRTRGNRRGGAARRAVRDSGSGFCLRPAQSRGSPQSTLNWAGTGQLGFASV